jgi:hypothetical protein
MTAPELKRIADLNLSRRAELNKCVSWNRKVRD